MSDSVADILSKFNRKERYWVVQNVLGSPGGVSQDFGSPAGVSQDFFKRLVKDPGISLLSSRLSRTAWWGVDYHFDWLFAALYMHKTGLQSGDFPPQINGTLGDRDSRAIKGQQEDIDLVIANDRDVILIEAKAFGSWGTKQIIRKLKRLKLLGVDDNGFIYRPEAPNDPLVKLHFVLMSPKRSDEIDNLPGWPKWALTDEKPHHIELEIPGFDSGFLRVVRCGRKTEDGWSHWKVE